MIPYPLKKIFGGKPKNAYEAVVWARPGQRLKSLEKFIADGGKFDPSFRRKGATELMHISLYVGIKGVELFFENGGKTNFLARADIASYPNHDRMNINEVMVLSLLRRNGPRAIDLYMEHGGRFNPVSKCPFSAMTEAMMIAKNCGAEGLRVYKKHGGRFHWHRTDYQGKSEEDYVVDVQKQETGHRLGQSYINSLDEKPPKPRFLK